MVLVGDISSYLRGVFQRFPHIVAGYLFGSYVRGEDEL